jgi:transcriptional regulator with XRE-family HTH domain
MYDSKGTEKDSADVRHEDLVAFGGRVRTMRQNAGMRQQDLAAAAGIDRIALSLLERGKRDVGVSRVYALARALNIGPDELLHE